MRFMKYLSVFVFSLFLMSCYSESEEDLFPVVVTPKDTTSGLTVSFATEIAPLIQTYCAIPACHQSNATFPTLESYPQINGAKDRIRARAVDLKTMPPPPRPRLTPNEINLLKTWLDEGARNN